jgi:hypothetical protein
MVRSNSSTQTADEILGLIELMPASERDRLFRMIDGRPDLSGKWAIVPLAILRFLLESHSKLCEDLKEQGHLLVKYANEAWRRGKCVRVKSEPRQHRRELIRQMIAGGEVDPAKIKKGLRNSHAIDVKLKTVRNDISALRRT